MERDFGILLAAHGNLAHSLLESTEMLVGPVPGAETVALLPGMGRDQLLEEMKHKLEKLCEYEKILIIADLVGGTPANTASELVATDDSLELIGGVNLAMLCEIAYTKNLADCTIANWLALGGKTMQDIGARVRSLMGQTQDDASLEVEL